MGITTNWLEGIVFMYSNVSRNLICTAALMSRISEAYR